MRSLARALAAGLVLLAAGPFVGAQPREVRLAFVGDTGTGDAEQKKVSEQIRRLAPSQVFLLGDNIYDRGSPSYFKERFDDVYWPLMQAGTVFHSALGNHDVLWCEASSSDPLPADAEAYVRLALRCDVEDHLKHGLFGYLDGRRYYSVRSDPASPPLVEVFVLDSNTLRTSQSKLHRFREDQAQLQWLDTALAVSRARWKVVTLHHPPHSPATPVKYWGFVPLGGGRAREYRLDAQLSPILRRRGADVVFAAHNHFYARMLPQNGIRYFVSGGGGRRVYPFEAEPSYVAAGGGFHHFVYVRATQEVFEYYVIDAEGRSRDAGRFTKGSSFDTALPPGTLPPPRPR